MMLAGVGLTASAGSYIQGEPIPSGISVEEMEVEEIVPADFAAPADVNGEGKVSEIARKMTQAEKAHNAAVNDGWGGAITIIAMCIVISALAVLSLLFLCFGKISEKLMKRTSKRAKMEADHINDESHHEVSSGEVIAAISLALTEHFDEGHDIEDTILTIQRMKKAYSPWNSKIYNLRTLPEHTRNQQPLTALSKR